MDQTFDTMFAALKTSLTGIISDSDLVTQRTEPSASLERTRAKLEADLRRNMYAKMQQDARNRLNHVRSLRQHTMKRLEDERERILHEKMLVREIARREYHSALIRSQVHLRRLEIQSMNAERRMRELVFEVIGEYGKSDLRMRRRGEYLSYVASMKHFWAISKTSWDRFCTRLLFEACVSTNNESSGGGGGGKPPALYYGSKTNLHSTALSRVEDADEMALVERYVEGLDSGRSSREGGRVVTVVKITKPAPVASSSSGGGGAGSTRAPPPPLSEAIVAETAEEMLGFKTFLRGWYHSNTRGGNSDSTANKHGSDSGNPKSPRGPTSPRSASADPLHLPVPSFLRAADVSWLHPASYHPVLWDTIAGNSAVYKLLLKNARSKQVQKEIARVVHSRTSTGTKNSRSPAPPSKEMVCASLSPPRNNRKMKEAAGGDASDYLLSEGEGEGKRECDEGRKDDEDDDDDDDDDEEEEEEEEESPYRNMSDGHLQLRRLLSSYSPQVSATLASAHVYMCLEEWRGTAVRANLTDGAAIQEDSPVKRMGKGARNSDSDSKQSDDSSSSSNMDGLDSFYRRIRSYYAGEEEYGEEGKSAGLGNKELGPLRKQLAKPLIADCFIGAHRQRVRSLRYSALQSTDTAEYVYSGTEKGRGPPAYVPGQGPPVLTPEQEDNEDTHAMWRALARHYPDAIRANVHNQGSSKGQPLHFLPATTYVFCYTIVLPSFLVSLWSLCLSCLSIYYCVPVCVL
jgi:hypothetical protein